MIKQKIEQASSVADAKRVLADLEVKRRALIEGDQEMAETHKRISYAAIADRDAKAREAAEREARALEDYRGPRWWEHPQQRIVSALAAQ